MSEKHTHAGAPDDFLDCLCGYTFKAAASGPEVKFYFVSNFCLCCVFFLISFSFFLKKKKVLQAAVFNRLQALIVSFERLKCSKLLTETASRRNWKRKGGGGQSKISKDEVVLTNSI